MRRAWILAAVLSTAAQAGVINSGVITSNSGGGGGGGGIQGGVEVVNVDAPSVPNNQCIDVLVSVPNLLDTDYVAAQAQCELSESIFVDGARIAGEGTVAVRVCNLSSAGADDPLPCDFQFLYVRVSP